MGSPSAFSIGQQIGNNFNQSMTRVKDQNTIDSILQQSMSAQDPQVLQNNIGKILSQVSPERQQAAMQFLQSRMGQLQTQQTQNAEDEANVALGLPKQFRSASKVAQESYVENRPEANEFLTKGYNAIINEDDEALRAIIQDPNVPAKTKKDLMDRRNKQDVRKSVQDREKRNRQTLVQNAYLRQIGNQHKLLKETFNQAKKREIEASIKELERLQKVDLGMLTKNPDAWDQLHLWGNVDEEFHPEDAPVNISQKQEKQDKSKIKFDTKNPEHVARANAVLVEMGGDKNKANAILAEEFTL